MWLQWCGRNVQGHSTSTDVLTRTDLIMQCFTNMWMDGWLGFYVILSAQIVDISCLILTAYWRFPTIASHLLVQDLFV